MWVVLEKCPAAVPCATADEESGSNLKLGSLCRINPTQLLKICYKKNPVSKMNPCIKISFPQIKL